MGKKAQAGIMLAISVLIIGLAIYGLYAGSKTKESEINYRAYESDYGYSVLTSFLRSTTSSNNIECRQVKDLILEYSKAKMLGGEFVYCCGITDKKCTDYGKQTFDEKLELINSTFKKNYGFYLIILRNDITLYEFGNSSIPEAKKDKIVASQKITTGTQQNPVTIKIYLTKRWDNV